MIYRVYYNGPDPPMWSIDQGTQSSEICVQHIELSGASITFHTDPSDDVVRAWVQVDGKLIIHQGIATFVK